MVGPFCEILERCSAVLAGPRVDHEWRSLARLDAPHPRIDAGLFVGKRGGDRAGRFLPELMAADTGSILDRDEPVLLRDLGRNAVLATELLLVRDRQQ